MISLVSQAFLILLMTPAWVDADGAKDKKAKPSFQISADEQELINLVNEARQKEKLSPVKPNKILFATARAHAGNMAQQKQMNHVLDGKGPAQRLLGAGYVFSNCAENIAAGQGQTLADVFNGWMNSPGHRANILGKQFRDIGIGIASGSDNQTYYTQVFGRARK